MICGLIGEHLSHSYSVEVHRALGAYDYSLWELAPNELGNFLRKKAFDGINVTIPYKQSVIPYLDELDETARAIGAVNTVVRRGDRLIGYNTDYSGMCDWIRRSGCDLRGKTALVLGTGGAARTARTALLSLGAGNVLLVSRTPRGDAISYEEAKEKYSSADYLFNATPCGMYPNPDGSDAVAETAIDLGAFPRLSGVFDAIYHPLRTTLCLQAKTRGIPAVGGLYLLVSQAIAASALFMGNSVAPQAAEKITRSLIAEKENIVLIGMPSCGKTTVGKHLAAKLDKPFFDTDEEIEKQAGRKISDIFREDGEETFRRLEANVIRTIARETSGAVIATGGGAVLREENIRALKRSGRLYFLDRPTEQLMPSADRPLFFSGAQAEALAKNRLPLYRAVADRVIENVGTIASAADEIQEDFYENFDFERA